ncbi:hypothetical protein I317_06498 [Kwoniella heveanensis CBS 569]|nr:hypothetical protein I317_06498 [Kwoniella heveanensis CBS 569]
MSDLQDITHLHGDALALSASASSEPKIMADPSQGALRREQSATQAQAPSQDPPKPMKMSGRPSPMGRAASSPATLSSSSTFQSKGTNAHGPRTTIEVGRPKVPAKKCGLGMISEQSGHKSDNAHLGGRPARPRFWSAVSDALLLPQRGERYRVNHVQD